MIVSRFRPLLRGRSGTSKTSVKKLSFKARRQSKQHSGRKRPRFLPLSAFLTLHGNQTSPQSQMNLALSTQLKFQISWNARVQEKLHNTRIPPKILPEGLWFRRFGSRIAFPVRKSLLHRLNDDTDWSSGDPEV